MSAVGSIVALIVLSPHVRQCVDPGPLRLLRSLRRQIGCEHLKEQIEEGGAKRLVFWSRGTALRLERTDAETAMVIKQAVADRIRDRIPTPGSQEALRHMLDAGRAGNPSYDEMSPEFAQVARGRLPVWQIVGQYFGANRVDRVFARQQSGLGHLPSSA